MGMHGSCQIIPKGYIQTGDTDRGRRDGHLPSTAERGWVGFTFVYSPEYIQIETSQMNRCYTTPVEITRRMPPTTTEKTRENSSEANRTVVPTYTGGFIYQRPKYNSILGRDPMMPHIPTVRPAYNHDDDDNNNNTHNNNNKCKSIIKRTPSSLLRSFSSAFLCLLFPLLSTSFSGSTVVPASCHAVMQSR